VKLFANDQNKITCGKFIYNLMYKTYFALFYLFDAQ